MRRIDEIVKVAGVLVMAGLLGACSAFKESGYGVGPQAERAALMDAAAQKQSAPDTPGMYLGLIERMQSQGLYYASLAHIDAYEKQYGASPQTILLRADALRMTDQPAASSAVYTQLLNTTLAARGYRGLGLIAGGAGDFSRAAQALSQATVLAPTDASTLSDLAYAKLRCGDIEGARIPLMKAAELDQSNPKIISNLVLYLLASGRTHDAQKLMTQQKLSADIRNDIRGDAAKIAAAARTWRRGSPASASASVATPIGSGSVVNVSGSDVAKRPSPVANIQGFDPTAPLLQRFAQ
ncbi:TPA: pilus assembly protein [Burkholderia stabilis]|uniref:Flp pilus assembly protein TadD, contains TPR repeats,type IV pilus biogenesis/stability protein PilW n=1 Tax=Burkholderia stabilis TaxID=95485 RepID=A0AAJ5N3T9_9BURK|nr:pilus assembly protein [Burkholderia stabilis]VBB10720.1 Flp pilus assembly protein TadD, contains TPR repeats,type IV pilus biogenesis/stability protein PilW [Burkholderia stabilis]HDR9585415.1 pilus assembly protein [Burkholderia stabilis]HDR9648782.1 pilus assembly protein [Burkholderia stabilis]HDR9660258.1 pilus assembly protein [Burkholderia stabilis]HDR9682369.1 pilus assembly protein [Burkholderia stabilis]